ncbi:hypothetical protein BH11PAT4_BH11PAT4_5400 [soil metagenome]
MEDELKAALKFLEGFARNVTQATAELSKLPPHN